MRLRRVILAPVACAALLTAILAVPAGPAEASSASSAYTWTGGVGGLPTWVTIVDRGSIVQAPKSFHGSWWELGNTTSDTYLFAFGTQSNVVLGLQFRMRTKSTPEVLMYEVHSGYQPLQYEFGTHSVRFLSDGGYPYLTMFPRSGSWLLPSGQPNFNLEALIQGASGVGFPSVVRDGSTHAIMLVGMSKDGAPGWQVMRPTPYPPSEYGYTRLSASVRVPGAPPYRLPSPLLPGFPFVAVETNSDEYAATVPPFGIIASPLHVQMNGFFGGESAGAYTFGSSTPPPHLDFESPFAFYNFIPDSYTPQLVVRSDSYPVGDAMAYLPGGGPQMALRYSWKVGNSPNWNYSLQLAAGREFTQKLHIGPYVVDAPSPSGFPSWVTHQKWPAMTFTQAMGGGYAGSEGIYFYELQGPQPWPYLLGYDNSEPSYLAHPLLTNSTVLSAVTGMGIPTGFRGEYMGNRILAPLLYVSPVDGLLHMQFAQGGYENFGNGTVVHEENLTGGPFIDGWVLETLPRPQGNLEHLDGNTVFVAPARATGVRVESQLYTVDGFAIYSGSQGIMIRRDDVSPAIIELSPPTTRRSWALDNRLTTPYLAGRSPFHMEAWVKYIVDPRQAGLLARGAKIRGLMVTRSGFSVILSKGHGGYAAPNLGLSLPSASGNYVLTLDERKQVWTVEPATGPTIAVKVTQPLRAYTLIPTSADVTISNSGTEFVQGVPLTLYLGGHMVSSTSVTLGGKASWSSALHWVPGSQPSNDEPIVLDLGGKTVFSGHLRILASARPSGPTLLRLQADSPGNELASLIILGAMTVLVGGGWLWTRLVRLARFKSGGSA